MTERSGVRSVSIHITTHSLRQDTEFADGKMYGVRRERWEIGGGHQEEECECSLEICGESGTNTRLLRWSVDGHKDEVRLKNALVDIGREKQIPSPRLTNDIFQPGFINR